MRKSIQKYKTSASVNTKHWDVHEFDCIVRVSSNVLEFHLMFLNILKIYFSLSYMLLFPHIVALNVHL